MVMQSNIDNFVRVKQPALKYLGPPHGVVLFLPRPPNRVRDFTHGAIVLNLFKFIYFVHLFFF